MTVPELRPWRTARPRVARAADAVRPRVSRFVRAAGPRVARLARATAPRLARITRPKTWQYTAGAATAGLALAAGVVTVAGPWDSTGQRTAERDRAVALGRPGGTDHGRGSGASGTSSGSPRPAPSAGAVLAGLDGTSAPGGIKAAPGDQDLADLLDPLLKDAPGLGGRRAAAVVDLTTGKRLYGLGPDAPLTPASTTKIATAVAALTALGPDHRLTTRTALEADTGEVVLVGGGDPTLTAREDARGLASLRTLAGKTAAALKKRGVREVTLSYDTTLYAGTEMHPIGVNENLARVTALMADEGRTDDSTSGPAPRVPDPAADAARTFAGLLKQHGVTASAPGPSKATGRADTLATVSSPPLAALVERMLTNSDNDLAEALARHTAVATGKPADFDGAGAAVTARLKQLGLPVGGARFHDGSGLDRTDLISPDLLTALLAEAADPARPQLRPVLTGLPVAHFTGTLAGRYTDGAAGLVRAKTGTLTGVNTLAGTVTTPDGRLLGFAFLANDTTDAWAAQSALDGAATTLASETP
ncbi:MULTISPECIES: D-alanyl-D-alanine carboxypeptidase/D-alanyl-D-alanine-endopeptidase [Streptomyces]|uniref:D-alanyl-D-alanine carboxypeptidase/D-alanyl-D-alanine-endopeptidase n=1 Tax=Streptomyces rubrogriseus TaxID=194673 RepID=A0ABT4P2I8_9ACTN|nr:MULTISPECIES: D-alanyl-D-alanine carboxypeptidase/D-alanyl-D-alanine-endopeptidase [Streptomyces]MBQ0950405.1 D-alanyl-D-alanine carboxypeptidase/D-alanyl-D-alanine-endopeptidase [Streptomyces sp. RK76]MCW8116662.1 D-alanyl-D-alanine carboxypeptidase/D-alanyl-D-alanine-endopeptidase [Streptomyces anthocyanicus]MCZ4634182.1 D-alanyl-D-alanine carboxypeptidase/D-alanyl-D-alanine-endopeptidase [Streptomyces rubrogriseus]MDX3410269.1 D-alanyl-D-alanine carboxypeptidase/D-alanyl-D-alanine-endopep